MAFILISVPVHTAHACICVVTDLWWQLVQLIYKMTNYFRISWSSQTANMEKHLLAAESWRGSAELKRSWMNWWRALCKTNPMGHPSAAPGCRQGFIDVIFWLQSQGCWNQIWPGRFPKPQLGRNSLLLGLAQSRSQVVELWAASGKAQSTCVLLCPARTKPHCPSLWASSKTAEWPRAASKPALNLPRLSVWLQWEHPSGSHLIDVEGWVH